MKKYLAFAMFLVLAVALASPFFVSAKTKAGVKSGSFFYFFDKAFEKADLFFTFNLEKKAMKTLENAEERLAEAEELKKETEEKENNDENMKMVSELKNEVEQLKKEFDELKQKPKISQSAKVAKETTLQNPQCLVLKEQIGVLNNKKTEISKGLKTIKGVNSSTTCDDKILGDQISCYDEQIKINQELVKKYEQQRTETVSIIKELQNDYKRYNCEQ